MQWGLNNFDCNYINQNQRHEYWTLLFRWLVFGVIESRCSVCSPSLCCLWSSVFGEKDLSQIVMDYFIGIKSVGFNLLLFVPFSLFYLCRCLTLSCHALVSLLYFLLLSLYVLPVSLPVLFTCPLYLSSLLTLQCCPWRGGASLRPGFVPHETRQKPQWVSAPLAALLIACLTSAAESKLKHWDMIGQFRSEASFTQRHLKMWRRWWLQSSSFPPLTTLCFSVNESWGGVHVIDGPVDSRISQTGSLIISPHRNTSVRNPSALPQILFSCEFLERACRTEWHLNIHSEPTCWALVVQAAACWHLQSFLSANKRQKKETCMLDHESALNDYK